MFVCALQNGQRLTTEEIGAYGRQSGAPGLERAAEGSGQRGGGAADWRVPERFSYSSSSL